VTSERKCTRGPPFSFCRRSLGGSRPWRDLVIVLALLPSFTVVYELFLRQTSARILQFYISVVAMFESAPLRTAYVCLLVFFARSSSA